MDRRERRARMTKRVIEEVQLAAAKTVAGLFKQPGEPGYNPDADVPWRECSTRTRGGLLVMQGTMVAERVANAQNAAPQVFGVVMMTPRIEDPVEWEKFAAATETKKVIEAVVAPAPEKKEGS